MAEPETFPKGQQLELYRLFMAYFEAHRKVARASEGIVQFLLQHNLTSREQLGAPSLVQCFDWFRSMTDAMTLCGAVPTVPPLDDAIP